MPNVTIRVLNDLPSPVAVEDIILEFYTTAGAFVTSGMTDVLGEATVLLPEALHDITFYKQGVSILPKQPQRIEVLADPPNTNTFVVTCHERVLPESTNPLRCTVSGYILGPDGLRARTRLLFTPQKKLLVLGGNVIAPESQVNVISDSDGYFEFELLRGLEYCGYFTYLSEFLGEIPGSLSIIVPNQPGILLGDLLFPVPIYMAFSENAKALTLGDPTNDDIEYTLTYSDGSSRPGGVTWASVTLTNTDDLVVEAYLAYGKLYLNPLSAGVAVIEITRTIGDFALISPENAYVSEQVTVTVT